MNKKKSKKNSKKAAEKNLQSEIHNKFMKFVHIKNNI